MLDSIVLCLPASRYFAISLQLCSSCIVPLLLDSLYLCDFSLQLCSSYIVAAVLGSLENPAILPAAFSIPLTAHPFSTTLAPPPPRRPGRCPLWPASATLCACSPGAYPNSPAVPAVSAPAALLWLVGVSFGCSHYFLSSSALCVFRNSGAIRNPGVYWFQPGASRLCGLARAVWLPSCGALEGAPLWGAGRRPSHLLRKANGGVGAGGGRRSDPLCAPGYRLRWIVARWRAAAPLLLAQGRTVAKTRYPVR